jgi:hypothetical protein
MLIANLNRNNPLYRTGERPRGPELSIYNRYIVGYLYIVYYKGLGSPAAVVYGLSLYMLERSDLARLL